MKKILCITGEIGSGKTTVAKYFELLGYKYFSVAEEIKRHSYSEKYFSTLFRYDIIDFAATIRLKNSNNYFILEIITSKSFISEQKIVIDGIRYLEELSTLKSIPHSQCYLIGIISTFQNRLNRVMLRKKNSDPKSEYSFIQNEELERENDFEITSQNVKSCLINADYVIENNSSIEYLKQKIQSLSEVI